MANMARASGPRGFLDNRGMWHQPGKYVPPGKRPVRGPAYIGDKRFYRPARPGRLRPGALPYGRPALPRVEPGAFPLLPGGGLGKLAYRFALNTLLAIASDWGTEWATQQSQSAPGGYTFPANWALWCTAGPPAPTQTLHKVVWYTGNNFCANSIKGGTGALWGTAIAAAQNSVSSVWSTVGAQPPYTTQGFTTEQWIRVGAPSNSSSIAFDPGGLALPLSDPFPGEATQMQPRATSKPSGYRGIPPYGVAASSIEFGGNRPPVRTPDDVHLNLPPEKGVDEEKPIDNTGRPLKKVYGRITELDDLAECMLKNLRKDRRGSNMRSVTPYGTTHRVARAAAEAMNGNVDWPAALECMVVSQGQDIAVGMANRVSSRRLQNSPYSPRRTSPVGWGAGGFATRMR